jgi:ABC-type uncharacterized transport system substrate-binding protein
MKHFLAVVTLIPCLGILPASAHPHVFIDNAITVLFDAGMLQGITFQWTFDDMFSNMIVADYDPGHTGHFDPGQTKALKSGAFDNLENYHYFIAIMIGQKPLGRFTIERFTPSVNEKSRLVYSFFVPLKLPLQPAEQTVRLTVYDESYFVAFSLLHVQDVTVSSGQDVTTSVAIEKTKVKPLWPGQYMPDQVVIKFKESS